MHTQHPANVHLDQSELSRRVAERYAVLSAVEERRALNRRSSGQERVVGTVRQTLAISD